MPDLDPVSIGGSVLDSVMGVANGIYGMWNANRNFEFQKEKYEYDKQQNEYLKGQADLTRSREDNAVQRRVADLKKAGMSPVLAAGSSASATNPVHVGTVTAPQAEFNPIDLKASNVSQSYMNLIMQKQNIAQSIEQTRAIQLQNDRFKYDTDWYKERGMPTNATGVGKEFSVVGSAAKGILEKIIPSGISPDPNIKLKSPFRDKSKDPGGKNFDYDK